MRSVDDGPVEATSLLCVRTNRRTMAGTVEVDRRRETCRAVFYILQDDGEEAPPNVESFA